MIEIGLQTFAREPQRFLKGRRVGLVTHAAAVAPDLTQTLDLLLRRGVHLAALFAPEHGMDGAGADATPIADAVDRRTGLPVYSLYGASKEPTGTMLEDIEVLVFDMQDVGARFYTFISTLAYVLRAAARYQKPVIVLDRPNPINGVQVEGPRVEPGLDSFIGQIPVPIRHALTTAEIAQFLVSTMRLDLALTLVPMQGWQRALWFDETGLPWVPLSPGMPHFATAVVYPGTCLIEGTNLSEGRGTALPFQVIGAPWVDGYALAQALNRLELPGVRFRPHAFTPTDSKHRGVKCGGVQVHVTARHLFRPVYMGLSLLATCRALSPDKFEFLATSWEGASPHLDLLTGAPRVREGLTTGIPVDEIVAGWPAIAAEFKRDRLPLLLYA